MAVRTQAVMVQTPAPRLLRVTWDHVPICPSNPYLQTVFPVIVGDTGGSGKEGGLPGSTSRTWHAWVWARVS